MQKGADYAAWTAITATFPDVHCRAFGDEMRTPDFQRTQNRKIRPYISIGFGLERSWILSLCPMILFLLNYSKKSNEASGFIKFRVVMAVAVHL